VISLTQGANNWDDSLRERNDVVYGNPRLSVSAKPIPLTTLTPGDEILAHKPAGIELIKDEHTKQYYVSSESPKNVIVEYLLKTPWQKGYRKKVQRKRHPIVSKLIFAANGKLFQNKDFKRLNSFSAQEKLQILLEHFSSFDEGELKGLPKNPTDLQIFQALLTQSKGSCMHRSQVCMLLAKQLGLSVCIAINQLHQWVVDTSNPEAFVTYDLGGYKVGVVVDKSHKDAMPIVIQEQTFPMATAEEIAAELAKLSCEQE